MNTLDASKRAALALLLRADDPSMTEAQAQAKINAAVASGEITGWLQQLGKISDRAAAVFRQPIKTFYVGPAPADFTRPMQVTAAQPTLIRISNLFGEGPAQGQ